MGTGYRVSVSGSVWVWCVGLSLWPVCLASVLSPNSESSKRDMQAQYYKVLSVPGIPGVAQYTGTQGPSQHCLKIKKN